MLPEGPPLGQALIAVESASVTAEAASALPRSMLTAALPDQKELAMVLESNHLLAAQTN